jgi:G3E family GTPase
MDEVPATLLTGFLGSGKTTLLNRLLKDTAFSDAAVIVNEFGEIGIDHLLVERITDDVVLLASGCLCCTMRGELVDTLQDLAARRAAGTVAPFRRLLLETTGLADPAPILQSFLGHPGVIAAYRLDGVVTLVDAVNGEATLDRYKESVRQVAAADLVLLSKTDLVQSAAADGLVRRLHDLDPTLWIADARTISPADVLAPGGRSGRAALGSIGHGHHSHHRHGAIRAFSLTADAPLQSWQLASFLDVLRERHGPRLLRMKGIVRIAEDPGRPRLLQAVQHVLHPVAVLPAWPTGDLRTRLVFIVDGLEPQAIEDLFAAFRGEPRLDRPDATALTDNPLALR